MDSTCCSLLDSTKFIIGFEEKFPKGKATNCLWNNPINFLVKLHINNREILKMISL